MKSIAIDMDEVLADYAGKIFTTLAEENNYHVAYEKIRGQVLSKSLPAEQLELVSALPHREGFFRDLKVIPDSQHIVRELYDLFDIFIVTAASPYKHAPKSKLEWLEEHFPFIPFEKVVICGTKRIIATDYMVDDHAKNLIHFSGKPILFTSFHNIYEDRFPRANNWKEVKAMLMTEV